MLKYYNIPLVLVIARNEKDVHEVLKVVHDNSFKDNEHTSIVQIDINYDSNGKTE